MPKLILKGGRVIDPSNEVDKTADVVIRRAYPANFGLRGYGRG
jgi:predicted amidohydrolase